MQESRYVLITPARNEEKYIRGTLESVIHQTKLPERWVIVSDGSVDRTDEIVNSYANKHNFIELIRAGSAGIPGKKDFGSKVLAFRAGYVRISGIPYEFIGNLDADITFSEDYFERVLDRFGRDDRLGVAGGIVMEPSGSGFAPQATSLNSVCGSVQLFRRQCYESFGGYIPIQMGGVDAAAEIMARMQGWAVETLPDIPVYAQRRVLTGGATIFHTRFRRGLSNYILGYSLLFQFASAMSRFAEPPAVSGSIVTLLGYVSAMIQRREKALPADVIKFLRSEQHQRLLSTLLCRGR
jgi:poly-beta-1,6-N-acetyl-D-glucosamine synthase